MEPGSYIAGERGHVQKLTSSSAGRTSCDSIYRSLAVVVGTAACTGSTCGGAKGTSSGKENSVEKEVFSTPLIEESRVAGAPGTYQKVEGGGGEHQTETVNAPEKLPYASAAFTRAAQCANIVKKPDLVDAATYPRAFKGRDLRHMEPIDTGGAALPSVSAEGVNKSGGVAAMNTCAITTERQVEVSPAVAVGAPGAFPVAGKRTHVFCVVDTCKSAVPALDSEGRPVPLISTTTPAKDLNEGLRISPLSIAQLASQEPVHECAPCKKPMREQPQQFPQDNAADIRGKGSTRESVEKKHLLVDVHSTQSKQHMSHHGQLIEPEKTRSDECGTANYLSADEKVKRFEQSVTPGSYTCLCTGGKKSNSGLRDDAQVLSVDPADGQAKAHVSGEFSTEFSPMQLQQSRHDSAENVPANYRVDEGRLLQKIGRINGNSAANFSRLRELRQFTLELLYAVSLLRPLGRRGSSSCGPGDTFNSQEKPAVDQRERVDVLTGVQLFLRRRRSQELEKGQTVATNAELQDASESDTRKCGYQQLPASVPAEVPLRRSQSCSSLGDIAALKRRVTEAVLLCKREETPDGISIAPEGEGKRHGVEGDETGRCEERSAGDIAANAALAAVASATGRSQHGSFETLAEKIEAATTVKEVAVYLCGCFGPLLHLLQEHMNQNRMQSPTLEIRGKNTGVSLDDSGVSGITAQRHAQGRHIGPHPEHFPSHGTHVDETVGGVNAVLQVLMEVDQHAADSILNSVCKRLFSSCHEQIRPKSLSLHVPTGSPRETRESEHVRQVEEGKPCSRGQQQQKNELIPADRAPLSSANVTWSAPAYCGQPDGDRSVFLGGNRCERRAGRQSHARDDQKEAAHRKTFEMRSALSPLPAAHDEQNLGTRKNQENPQTESEVCENVQVGDQTQVSDGGIIFSAGQNVEAPSGDASPLYARQEHVESLANSSSSVTVPVALHTHHDVANMNAAAGLLGSYRAAGTEGDVTQTRQSPLSRQQHQQKVLCKQEEEEYTNVHGGSTEGDESLSRRTAWLAAQLSTPLDILGGDSMRETGGDKNEKSSEEVTHTLETLEVAVLQPSASSLTNSSAAAANEKELSMESSEQPREWETGVQLVLRMLREQEEQLSASEAAAGSAQEYVSSSRERHPKRRAVLDESQPEQAVVRQSALAAKNQLRSSAWSARRDADKAEERLERTAAPHRTSPAGLASSTGRGMAAKSGEEITAVAADQPAAFRRIAAAAAVERAARAVAQQGAVAAVEHARVGSAELMDKMRDLEGLPVAGLFGPTSAPTTELAASSWQALRRAVEFVEPSKDEENAAEDATNMFADLDDEGLDSLVSQLLKIAERPTEQQRRQENRKQQLKGLISDTQGTGQQEYRHGSQHDLGHGRPPHLRRSHHFEAYQPYPQQRTQWKETVAEGQIVRRGSSGDGADVSRHLFFQRETNARRTDPDFLDNSFTSNRAGALEDHRTEAVSSYLRTTEILHREEKLLPPRVAPALLNPFELSTTPEWSLRRRSASSTDRRLSLNPPGSPGNAFSSPVDSPLMSRCGRYILDTPTQSDERSFGPSQRQSNMKRSPWRSCEPYSSSASTMVASPLAASAKSFGSSLTSSPFSLLPTSATAAMQPLGVTPDVRLETAGDAITSGRSTGDRLVRGGAIGRVEPLPADNSALLRDYRSHRNSSTRAESGQRRFSAGGENLLSGFLPARVSGAECPSTRSVYSSTAASRRTTELKTTPGQSVTEVEGGHYRDIAADSLHAQLRALDFFDISASARAHLLAEAASPSVPVLRALSSFARTVPATHEVNTLAGRRQGQSARIVRTQTATGAQAAQEESVKFLGSGAIPFSAFPREEERQRSTKAAAPMKLEHSRMLSPRLFSNADVRPTSESGFSTRPAAVLQPSESSKAKLHEVTRFIGDAPLVSAGEQSRSERLNQQPGQVENWDCIVRRTRGDKSATATKRRDEQEEHRYDTAASMASGQSWSRANAGFTGRIGRQQQQQIVLAGKEFWLKGSGAADRKDPRRAQYAGGECQEESSSNQQHYESLPSSPVFTRCMPAGGRKEAAVAGCVGTGGADCLCGGALCLYRSAVSGVVYDKSGQKWTARWNEDGRQHKRTFAAAKYGFLTAKLKAEACRGEARERTARSKHEALHRQQESLAHRLGLFSATRSGGNPSQPHVCTERRSSATPAAPTVEEQEEVRS